jgi:translation initiation factor 2 beta subunit (eIF-2beta)/eIF-5
MVKLRLWSEKEIKRLRELYTSNQTFDEIIKKFPSRSENAIRLKASRLGLKRPIISNINQMNPLNYISISNGELSGHLLKCTNCGSWIKIYEKNNESVEVISCKKCGNFNQILTKF